MMTNFEGIDRSRQDNYLDPRKLETADVGIIGSGSIANFLCAYLTALGIGNITLISQGYRNKKNYTNFLSEFGGGWESEAKLIGATLEKLDDKYSVARNYSQLGTLAGLQEYF